jgi:hypothetical protein
MPWGCTGQWKCRSTVINLDTRWRWDVNFTLLLPYAQGNSPRYSLKRRLVEPQGQSGLYEEDNNILFLSGIEPRLVWPSRYTDWAIPRKVKWEGWHDRYTKFTKIRSSFGNYGGEDGHCYDTINFHVLTKCGTWTKVVDCDEINILGHIRFFHRLNILNSWQNPTWRLPFSFKVLKYEIRVDNI